LGIAGFVEDISVEYTACYHSRHKYYPHINVNELCTYSGGKSINRVPEMSA